MDAMIDKAVEDPSLTPQQKRDRQFVHLPKPEPSQEDEDAEHEALMHSIEEEDAREVARLQNESEDDGPWSTWNS